MQLGVQCTRTNGTWKYNVVLISTEWLYSGYKVYLLFRFVTPL